MRKRCGSLPGCGEPAAIETVDKFQGQQADIVLLSLVRTRAVGHRRVVRRLVVALSRARLGLLIFARAGLFLGVPELRPALAQLEPLGLRLQLLIGESSPTQRPAAAPLEATLKEGGGLIQHVAVENGAHMASIVTTLEALIYGKT